MKTKARKITRAHQVSLFSVESHPQYHLSLINVRPSLQLKTSERERRSPTLDLLREAYSQFLQ